MLDIGVGDAASPYQPSAPAEPSLGLEDDGYYWFLNPLFGQLAGETGQYIDLYGYAAFAGPDLAALDRMLSEARRLVEAQPESWPVQTAVAPVLHKPVLRDEFLRLLSTWECAALQARELGRAVICFGD